MSGSVGGSVGWMSVGGSVVGASVTSGCAVVVEAAAGAEFKLVTSQYTYMYRVTFLISEHANVIAYSRNTI